jgi:predicted nucleic acid-binding protein
VTVVLDASAAIELLLDTAAGRAVAHRIADPRTTLHAPHLIDLEVAQVIRRCVVAGDLQDHRGRAAIHDLGLLGIERYAHSPFLPRIWALRDNLTAYDAAYVALAEMLDAPLVTLDARIAGAPGHRARVEVIPSS